MAGERKQQILESLAKMLESPKREKSPQPLWQQSWMFPKLLFTVTLPIRHKCLKA